MRTSRSAWSSARFSGDSKGVLRRALVRVLAQQSDVYLVSLERAKEVAESHKAKLDAPGARAIGKELGVVALLEGKAVEHGGKWTLTLKVRSTSDGEVAESSQFEGGTRRELVKQIDKSLWSELGPPLVDAKGPAGGRKRVALASFGGKKASTARTGCATC